MSRKIQQLTLALLLAGLALTLTLTPIQADSPPTFLLTWGSAGSAVGQFSFPSGVAVDSSDNVYVADTNNFRIQKFDNNGGSGTVLVSGSFPFWPFDVAVDSAGNIYVADTGNSLIQKFDSSGGALAPVATSGSGHGEVSSPIGVAVDQNDNVYVADTNNNRVQKFDSGGNFDLMWGFGVNTGDTTTFEICTSVTTPCQAGSPGSGNGQFNAVSGVAVDETGNIYVIESGHPILPGFNNRVQKFDSNGNFVTKWGDATVFNQASNVAVDGIGNVYVADTFNNRIQKFNSNGDLATAWGSIGTGNGQFTQPGDLAFDSAGNVFVADAGNNRIQKFHLPSLSLIKTVDNDNPNPGQRITYTITVDNNDTVAATNAVISDTLPNELTLAGSATLQGSGGSVAQDAGDLPTLASGLTIGVGQRITVTFPVTVNTGLPANTVITNTASVTSTQVVTPQTGSTSITINPINLTLIKTVSELEELFPNPGQQITYTITVSNSSLSNATGAVISDTLPDGLTFAGPVGLEGSSGTVAQDAGDLPTLVSGLTIAAGTRITVTLPVTVNTDQDHGTIIINTAAVTSAEVTTPQTGLALSIVLSDTIVPTFPFTDPFTGSPLITPTLGISLGITQPVFEWLEALDNGKILTYFLTLSNTLGGLSGQSTVIFSTTQTSFTPTTNLSNGDYTWTVQAQDAAGNVNTTAIPPQSFTIAADSSNTSYLPIILKIE